MYFSQLYNVAMFSHILETHQVLLDEERVRAIGVSNFLERHLDVILEECSVVPHINQCEFHPFNNPKLLREYCAERKIQFEVRICIIC